ncbi:MAG: FAD-dependent oxidoreductase [Caldilineae bacterium]|nr:MAG: FAD-dependent oxidoreductase [Caldilineae bacterium]
MLQKHGVSAAILDGDAARALAPQATDRVVGGVYFPDDAHLTPDRFVQALAQRAVEHGARLETGIDVIGFETGDKRITGVMTNRGVIRADQIVLAAGAWSPQLSRDLDLPLDVQPAKGYSITVERPEGFPELPMHLVEGKVVVTPMGETLRFAGTLELAGLDESVNRRRVEAIRRVVPQYLKVDPYAGLVEIWRGLRPLSPDTLPVIGRSRRWENLVIATGHGMLGMSLGPITGQLVADLVTGSPPSLDLTPFRPDRMERLLA